MLLRKRLISMLTAIACMISVLCVFGQISTYSSRVNAISTLSGQSAEDITSQMTIGWNLGNTLDCYNSSYTISTSPKKFATCWGNPEPTQELFETVKNAGFNTVRIPTTWYQHIAYNEDTDTYEIEPNWLAYVKKTVDYAYNLDMFIILNVHHEQDFINIPEFTDETLAVASKKLGDIWKQVAEEFKDYDQKLIFEGMNEPRQTGNSTVSEWGNGSEDNGYTWNYINTLNNVFINAIRSNGSSQNNERLLMIPGYCATSDTTALNNVTIPENSGNIALSVHAYAPYFFTMDTSDYANHTFPGKSGWGEDYESSLKSLFSNLKSVSDSKGVPIIIGEFSASDFENTADRVAWAKCYLSNSESAGIPCVLWDNNVSANGTGEAHGYIYRLTNTIYPNSADVLTAMMDTVGVTNYTLPEYKEYVAPTFSWDIIPVTDNWVELYKSQDGEVLKSWDNIQIPNWKDYISEDYNIIVVYDATTEPNIIFQGGWYQIPFNDMLSEDFITGFTYDDIINDFNNRGISLDEINKFYVGATSGKATIYGVYAVPVNATTETTTSDITTETTTSSINIETMIGDVTCDGQVMTNDLLMMKKYLLGVTELSTQALLNADLNGDGQVMTNDLLMLKKTLLGVA